MKQSTVSKLLWIVAAAVFICSSGTQSSAATWDLDETYLDVSQLDLTYASAAQPNSAYGQLHADYGLVLSAAGGSITDGYVSMYNPLATSTDMWVVKNMSIDAFSGYAGISTMFDLGNTPGTDVTALTMKAVLSDVPLTSFPMTSPDNVFAVGDMENNAEGAGGAGPADGLRTDVPGGLGERPDTSTLTFSGFGIRTIWQPGHPNVEQAANQCMPAAVANSLQWLEDVHGINVPHNHVAGERDNSLVGQLDQAMNRPAGQAVSSAQNYITGKLDYIDDNELEDDLVIKHKERNGINWLNNTQNSPSGNATSNEDQSARSLIDWILDELEHGEDVEVRIGWDGGGGHMIDLIGGGNILGERWIAWVHDAVQGKAGGVNLGDGGIGWSSIKDNKITVYIGGKSLTGTIDFATSESIPEPATLVLLAIGGLALLRKRRA